ncbi:MAG: SMC-Scp complex subunit ScpB [Candidatus Komeilibacteria bacterium CG_4_10_14_0_2_um_filter_37_10]|uniref:SMC-Scp complex subunit ScpB n=1 Tax=Candidatus Komeilibacteria bacterium CG_4_10_14_0_2_um_filter_37_10 TaxID=1974470 RepID=A0A2M7VF97_9BACT|nr:MAG: SMC-Scp complex subunit ScpB [Candidatus Komeilibacteria bacterium CG_4_10_14_0_2_um_filter_37_10]
MNKTTIQIESLLLIASKPLKISKIKEILQVENTELISASLQDLKDKYNGPDSGLRVIENAGVIQLTTSPDASETIKKYLQDETTGELSRPSLETLTIVAYRQPISKSELEQIRGVNCSLILRNLMIRGLIIAKEDKRKLTTYYYVTVDFLKFMGINNVAELPDYEKLNNNKNLQQLVQSEEDSDQFNTVSPEPIVPVSTAVEEFPENPVKNNTGLKINIF